MGEIVGEKDIDPPPPIIMIRSVAPTARANMAREASSVNIME